MSFSLLVKEELTRSFPEKACCRKAELAAFLSMSGSVLLSGQRVSLSLNTENPAVARRIIRLAKAVFAVETETVVEKKTRLRKNNVYSVRIPPQSGLDEMLQMLGREDLPFLPAAPAVSFAERLKKPCCKRAYLRAAFLCSGSVNDPGGAYHLEISCADPEQAELLAELCRSFSLQLRQTERKGYSVLYLKESEQIVDMLNVIGAHKALLDFENVRIVKEMRNNVNRLVNCETANINKAVDTGTRQAEDIRLIVAKLGFEALPPNLRVLAELRLLYPNLCLKELGQMLTPPLGKSGVNHRMQKLEELARELREDEGKRPGKEGRRKSDIS